ncbi:MAG: YdcF family protein [Gammaproteobacteria bacterium]|nr:YdcF family protein [Gammaproteobacteria bacterium]
MRWLKRGLFLVLLLTPLYLFHKPILEAYAEWFIIDNATKGADAILILAGGVETRPPKAIELYRQGYAPRVLLTQEKRQNSRYAHIVKSEPELMRAILRYEQVPAEFLPTLNDGVTSTFDEAYDLAAYAKQYDLQRIIIVTSDFHTRRALFAFEKVLRQQGVTLTVEMAAASNDVYNPQNWWATEAGLRSYVTEFFKFLVYLVSSQNLVGIKEG